MMTRQEILRYLQSEIIRLRMLCLEARKNAVCEFWGENIPHALCLWLLPSGEVSSVRTTERDASGRCPLRVLNHTPEGHEKMKKQLGLGYTREVLLDHVAPTKVMFVTNLQAWLLAGNYAGLGEHMSVSDLITLGGVPAQGRPRNLVSPAIMHGRIKAACRQRLTAPKV